MRAAASLGRLWWENHLGLFKLIIVPYKPPISRTSDQTLILKEDYTSARKIPFRSNDLVYKILKPLEDLMT